MERFLYSMQFVNTNLFAIHATRISFNNMITHDPGAFYKERLETLNAGLAGARKKKNILGALRLCLFLAAIITGWALLSYSWQIAIAGFLVLFTVFLGIVSMDLANSSRIDNLRALIHITEEEIAAIGHEYTGFPDGSEFLPAHHTYAGDLDIFGRASLYQFTNRGTSDQGRRLLADWMLQPADPGDISLRQDAARELADMPEWRQQLQAFGRSRTITSRTEENISAWLREPADFLQKPLWITVRILFPLTSFSILALYLFGTIPQSPFLTGLVVMLFISFVISKRIMPAYVKLNKVSAELEALSTSINWIERTSFKSPLLLSLQQQYAGNGEPAATTIRKLKKILDRLDYRLNPVVFIPLSAFLCWDLQQIFALEKWKTKNVNGIREWFSALGAFEALASLGNLRFNHPAWCFPEIVTADAVFEATSMGHPLIPPAKCVLNSFSTSGVGQLNLVTGSNMAGKSTFLRSTGVNMVLAMMGAPVFAKALKLSPMRVMSSMRISDNLEENTSTFYAELKKLKEVIDAVNKKEKVFLLLDEILRGTNSADRHTGSAALLKQLVQKNAAGMVATHDLELAKLESAFPGNIRNFHFDVQVENEELYFDYKLKEGVCKSMNASILMKKIGIEVG